MASTRAHQSKAGYFDKDKILLDKDKKYSYHLAGQMDIKSNFCFWTVNPTSIDHLNILYMQNNNSAPQKYLFQILFSLEKIEKKQKIKKGGKWEWTNSPPCLNFQLLV